MRTATNLDVNAVPLVRVRCSTPMNLKFVQRHKATGLVGTSAFSAHSVLDGIPGHPDPAHPSLDDLVTVLRKWNEFQDEWEYSLCQDSQPPVRALV